MNITLPLCLTATLLCSFGALAEQSYETVEPVLETRAHFNDDAGMNADVDDPAIWVHPTDTSKSFIVGALKQGGMDVYDLDGQLLQYIAPSPAPVCLNQASDCKNESGRMNNADLIYDFKLGDEVVDLIVVSDRGLDKLAIFKINPNAIENGEAPLIKVSATNRPWIFSDSQDDVNEGNTAYGLATSKTDKALAYVTQNSTSRVAILELYDAGSGKVGYKESSLLKFPTEFSLTQTEQWEPCSDDDSKEPHLEGLVADVQHNAVYLSQEEVGLWKIKLDTPLDKSQWQLIHRAYEYGIPYTRTWNEAEEEYDCELHYNQYSGLGNKNIHTDVEGLTIYDAPKGRGYLLLSSQSNDQIAVFEREGDNAYIGSFHVGDGVVDEVNHTDSLMVSNINFGGEFSEGLLVIHDGDNQPGVYDADGEYREVTNFKYVQWSSIAKALDLIIDTTSTVRK